ncbi:unnamed protein product, partial [Mesorhabditis spiculigera]
MSSGKVWVGPLLLILLIALIYIFSLLPHSHHKDVYGTGLDFNTADETGPYPIGNQRMADELVKTWIVQDCSYHGYLREADGKIGCACLHQGREPLFEGPRCEFRKCINNGTLVDGKCECVGQYMGENCELTCHGEVERNGTRGATCDCPPLRLGKYCDQFCDPTIAQWDNVMGRCICKNTGDEARAIPHTHRIDCPALIERRPKGMVNSRLTLSGLSFCLITIGLLCITARRRRLTASSIPASDETWYRFFQPQAAGRRCRHDFVCGGAWVPRDRALLVGTPARAPTQARIARNNRSLTPPPSYCSVELVDGSAGAPPSYEEAVHRSLAESVIDDDVEVVDEDKEPQTPQGAPVAVIVAQIDEEAPPLPAGSTDENANISTEPNH